MHAKLYIHVQRSSVFLGMGTPSPTVCVSSAGTKTARNDDRFWQWTLVSKGNYMFKASFVWIWLQDACFFLARPCSTSWFSNVIECFFLSKRKPPRHTLWWVRCVQLPQYIQIREINEFEPILLLTVNPSAEASCMHFKDSNQACQAQHLIICFYTESLHVHNVAWISFPRRQYHVICMPPITLLFLVSLCCLVVLLTKDWYFFCNFFCGLFNECAGTRQLF